MKTIRPKDQQGRSKRRYRPERASVEVDVGSLLSIDNRCGGCARGERCCCSSYDVCVTAAEMKRIIRYLPAAARYCPHLITAGGYDNIFDEEERGLFSLDTDENGLCVFAYWSGQRTHCSLHMVALDLGLPLSAVKPKVCLLWPMHFSEGREVLSLISDAMRFHCNVRQAPGTRSMSPGFVQAIELVYGAGCGEQVERAASNGEQRTVLVSRQ